MSSIRSMPGAELLAGLGAAVLVGMLLVAVGQPIFTDDLWWHLALGRDYLEHGPWLDADPLLHTAAAAPSPAAWLFDAALFGLERAVGLQGLRVAHVAGVAGILLLVFRVSRRASASGSLAAAATAIFACTVTYRAVQLRPELATIGFVLVLYGLLVEPRSPPSRRRIAGSVFLLWLWANLHSGFLLGPILLGAALCGVVVRGFAGGGHDVARIRALGIALVLGLFATVLNPDGVGQHLAYLEAGVDTPELARIGDEWSGVALFRLPTERGVPTALSWTFVWILVVVTPLGAWRAALSWREGREGPDPALVSMALASLVAMVVAVRFTWLGLFPMLLLLSFSESAAGSRRRALAWSAAAITTALIPAYTLAGDWPLISRALSPSLRGYARPYPASKYREHAVRFLRDAGLTGRLSNEYHLGGFLGFWLAPELRAFVNGTLNVPKRVLDASVAIRERRGLDPNTRFVDLLDEYEVDVFFGAGLPRLGLPGRPSLYSTAHLEGEPGWILVFRNLESAVYLRDDPAHAANLQRVEAYYARERIAFDRTAGFEARRVLLESPRWALGHGLIPVGFRGWIAQARGGDPKHRGQALGSLAGTQAALGLYADAADSAGRLLRSQPDNGPAARIRVWSLLRDGRSEEARAAADALSIDPGDALTQQIAETARAIPTLDPEAARTRIARLPLFTREQGFALLARMLPTPPLTQ